MIITHLSVDDSVHVRHAQIGKYSAIFAVIYANAPNFIVLSQSSALAARSNKVYINNRTLLKFDMKQEFFFKMFMIHIFCTSQP